jgi:hypothetical protein
MNRSFEESRSAPATRHARQNNILMDKSAAAKLFLSFRLWLSIVFTFNLLSAQADQIKANNNSFLESCGSWVSSIAPDNGNYNANFYILIPVYTPPASIALSVSTGGTNGNIGISFPTQPGYGYQVEYTTNLTDAVWVPLGNTTAGDGTIQSVNEVIGNGSRFYRVRVQ